jgi:hypothetical protein
MLPGVGQIIAWVKVILANVADVFMLNRFPCRMVELVGWVAGVDDKEKAQTVYRESVSMFEIS